MRIGRAAPSQSVCEDRSRPASAFKQRRLAAGDGSEGDDLKPSVRAAFLRARPTRTWESSRAQLRDRPPPRWSADRQRRPGSASTSCCCSADWTTRWDSWRRLRSRRSAVGSTSAPPQGEQRSKRVLNRPTTRQPTPTTPINRRPAAATAPNFSIVGVLHAEIQQLRRNRTPTRSRGNASVRISQNASVRGCGTDSSGS